MGCTENLRNIAIIAHVDHGKTTLVDQMLKQSGTFRANEQVAERVMDSNDLERERGITILSKNTSVWYHDIKINIVDTPGHADFGGEVERILTMVDGVLLLVDAFEGCMPQTRFVLKKALGLGKNPIVVVNKIDRPMARPQEVVDEVLDLFIELGADDDQLEFPVVYASGRDGYASMDPDVIGKDLQPLFETIVHEIQPPQGDPDGPLQILFSNIDYDDYLGRIGVGRVERGHVQAGQQAVLCHTDGTTSHVKIAKLYTFEGLRRTEVESARLGDIISVSGIPDLNIGETACDPEHVEPLPFVKIDEPTLSMNFMVNNSPFAGREGKFVTSRNLRDRLFKEVETNVSLRVKETDSADTFEVSGRGELHLSILIETMRRQGYEFQVSRPSVIYKYDENGRKLEPIELLMIEVPEEYVGAVMERLGTRKAELQNMGTREGGSTHLEFLIPARGLMGYRSQFLTDTNGNGIMNHVFHDYEPYKGDIEQRLTGSIVVHESGETTGYGLFNTQSRGRLFVGPGVEVYEGMIVGENPKNEDIVCNVCKKKQATNMRAAGSDDALKLVPPSVLSLEQSLEFIKDDELVEVTPKSIRLRKRILSKELRMKQASKNK
ncbi:MAG TPA: translational GTPase TypA [Firmicutes bacterium]|nr:translational GTPase TypA [Bacillota bacterium]